jgi:hypothetical protein
MMSILGGTNTPTLLPKHLLESRNSAKNPFSFAGQYISLLK